MGRRVDGRPPLGRHRGRLRAHRAGRVVVGRPRRRRARSPSTSARRAWPGAASGSPARPATDRCRSARTTRSSRRPRSCAGSRRTDPPPTSTISGRPRSTRCRCPTISAPASSRPITSGTRSWACRRRSPARVTHTPTRRSRRTSCTVVRRRTRSPTPSTSISTSARFPEPPRRTSSSTSGTRSGNCSTRSSSACCSTPTRPARSSGPATQLWDTLTTHTQVAYPGAKLIPGLIVGGTDARFYRERGKVAYGAGLFSPEMDFASFGTRFHGNDERIDIRVARPVGQLLLRHRQGTPHLNAEPATPGSGTERCRFSGRGRVRSRVGPAPSRPRRRSPTRGHGSRRPAPGWCCP